MPFVPHRTHEVRELRLSAKQGAAYGTIVADIDLSIALPVFGYDFADVQPEVVSDMDKVGKGNEYATGVYREVRRSLTKNISCDLSSLMAGWAAGFGMGKVVTSQPNAALNPTCYKHIFTFMDPLVTKQVPVTTIYEDIIRVDALRRRLESMAVSEFTISGNAGSIPRLQISLVGSGKTTDGTLASTAFSTLSILDWSSLTFSLGAQAAAADISARLISYSIKINQNLDLANSYVPGSGTIYRSRMWQGARRPTFEARVLVDQANADLFSSWIARSKLEVIFDFEGDLVLAGQPEKHSCTILFPAVRLTAAKPVVEGDWVAFDIAVGDDGVMKDSTAVVVEPVRIIVIGTQTAYLGT